MQVLLVDNDRLLLEALSVAMQARHPDLQVDLAASEPEALALAGERAFDLILLDWWLGEASAAGCYASLREQCPQARIVVMSGDDRPRLVYEVLELGAAGFLCKNAAGFAEMREAIDIVARGGGYLPGRLGARDEVSPSVRQRWQGRSLAECFPALSPQQQAVLRVLLRGVSDKVIARELDVEVSTVKTHKKIVFRRLGVNSRAEAVALAARMGVMLD